MPTSLFWRMVGYANRATGAWCLLQWVENIKEQ
jgi:hypothetical protein